MPSEPAGHLLVYSNIEALCRDRGINMTILCRESGVPRSTLTDLHKGRQKSLSTRNLNRIASYFGVSLDRLVGQPDEAGHAADDNLDDDLREYLDELRNRSEMRMLFSTTRGASREQIEAIVAMVEALQKQGGQ